MKTIRSIFDAFNGPANFGRVIGVSTEHAATMRRRNSIPVRYWSVLVKAAEANGIALTPADLMEANAPSPKRRASA